LLFFSPTLLDLNMSPSFIIDVTEADFEYEVIQYSQKTPVVVDFWADWCIPCKTLSPILMKLTEEAQGDFRLAKLDVDENPKLAQQFNVRGLPAVKGFRNGMVVTEFTGAQPETQVRKFIDELIPGPSDLQLEKGESLLHMEEWVRAETAFRQVLDERRRHPGALLGLSKCLLTQGKGKEALEILDHFPASREFNSAQQLRPLATALARREKTPGSGPLTDATYSRALQLITRSNLPAAMDGLLAVLKEDKNFRDGEARLVLLSIFEILGNENLLTRQYRAELATILY
jgi:putative thioredoxin